MARRARERIYLIPRWSGLVFAFFLLLIFALGFAFPHARVLTHTFGIALLVAAVVILIQTNENLRGVEIVGCRSVPTSAGDPIVLEILLRNGSSRERIGLQARQSTRWYKALRGQSKTSPVTPVLEAGGITSLELRLEAKKRGLYAVPALWVCSTMPVGLCFAWKVFAGSGEYFVYPHPHGVPLERDNQKGREANDGPSGDSEDVSGHRPYQPGDPLTRMDWKVFARTGKVAVRTLEEGSGGEVDLRWDDTRFLQDDEERLEQLSYWVAQCVREARPFRLHLGGNRGELSHRNIAGCHQALATFGENRS